MPDPEHSVPFSRDADPERSATFRAALERIGSMRTAGVLRSWLSGELTHEVYRAPADSIRGRATPDRVPNAMARFVLQYFVPLDTEGADRFPEETRVGSSLLGPTAPVTGILLPAVVRGTSPGGELANVAGTILVPGFASIPAHIPRIGGTLEVLVFFGTTGLTGAYYDASADALVLDVLR